MLWSIVTSIWFVTSEYVYDRVECISFIRRWTAISSTLIKMISLKSLLGSTYPWFDVAGCRTLLHSIFPLSDYIHAANDSSSRAAAAKPMYIFVCIFSMYAKMDVCSFVQNVLVHLFVQFRRLTPLGIHIYGRK